MVGAIIIVIALLVAIPVGVALSGAGIAGVLGFLLKEQGEANNEGSELIELNR